MAHNIRSFYEMIFYKYQIKLKDRAYKKEVINDVIEQFGNLNYSKLIQQTGKYIFLNMLYELYQNKDYLSMKKIDEGIEKLYNSHCIKTEDKYANALFCIAKVIYKNKSLDDVQINGILDVIASLGNVCITGQRRGIIQLVFEFRDEIQDFLKYKIKISREKKPIRRMLDEIFFEARIKVANKLMNNFYINKSNRSFTDPHMEDFFKKCLNEVYHLNIPIMSEADPIGFNIEANRVFRFLKNQNIENLILERVVGDIRAKCNNDANFYNVILDWVYSYFYKNKIDEDISEFLSSHVFLGESKNLRSSVIYKILECEDYIMDRSELLNKIIKSNEISEQVYIIKNNADILSIKNQNDMILQEYLILSNDLDAVKLMNHLGCINLNLKNRFGDTPLVCALKCGFFDIVKFLIDIGASVQDRDEYGNTLIMIACKNNDIKMAKLLIEKGINIEEKDICNESVLVHACRLENLDVIKLLLDNKVNVNVRSKEGYTLLMFNYKEILIPKLLIEHGANVNEKVVFNITPLMYACEMTNFDMVKLLVENGANINEEGRCKQTALMYACEFKSPEIVEYLIKNGADVEKKALGGATALIFAFFTCVKDEEKNFQIVKLLLEHGALVNEKGAYGSATVYACKYWNARVLKLLIEHGADLNEKDVKGKTLLKLAYERGNMDIVNILRRYESRINVVSNLYLNKEFSYNKLVQSGGLKK